MEHTFFLKALGNKKTSIVFSCYFKNEAKQFKYSTGENILPVEWDFKENRPILKGSKKAANCKEIKTQLDRYSEMFEKTVGICTRIGEDITSKLLRDEFDKEFKKSSTKGNNFFQVYDEFTTQKQKKKEWKSATIKRYKNIKNHLESFEKSKKYKLTFNKINDKFFAEFSDYCYTTANHSTNTFARNVGLFKTFMIWAYSKKYTYNDAFVNFKKPEKVITKEVALTLDQVKVIFEHKCDLKSFERVKDVFVFLCLTGLRYGEIKLVNKNTVRSGVLSLSEEKDVAKEPRVIPLNELAVYILKKYDYDLPFISNQKFNSTIKDVVGSITDENDKPILTYIVESRRNKNRESEIIEKAFNKRVASHTGRRTFITIMKKKGIADKTIMEMTGHRDLKTFNTYYKVDDVAKVDAVKFAFGTLDLPKLKVI
ncbi:tyrosine-type recombinase/integrase [Bizionia sp.]|uniref:tyrosine-type recombinase/integrase n=1 Tax=Bizionia sp. TaxID=1954480 RepID=UPI003A92B0E5